MCGASVSLVLRFVPGGVVSAACEFLHTPWGRFTFLAAGQSLFVLVEGVSFAFAPLGC